MAYLSMTRLKLKSFRYLVPFLVSNEKVVGQIRVSDGFLKGKLLATPDLSMWTATLWVSEEALKAFYLSGDHRVVMAKISEWASETVTGHQLTDTAELPSWSYISDQLSKVGHFTKLKEPSSDHLNHVVPNPKITILTRFLSPKDHKI